MLTLRVKWPKEGNTLKWGFSVTDNPLHNENPSLHTAPSVVLQLFSEMLMEYYLNGSTARYAWTKTQHCFISGMDLGPTILKKKER